MIFQSNHKTISLLMKLNNLRELIQNFSYYFMNFNFLVFIHNTYHTLLF